VTKSDGISGIARTD